MSTDAIIRMQDVRMVFTSVDGDRFTAVEELNLEVGSGDIVAIVGKTGCGKSTTFNLLLGLDQPTSGSITLLDHDPYEEFDYFRSKLGVIFQTDRLLPWRTALENARVGLEILGYDEKEQNDIALEWLHKLELQGFEDAYPHELSGGMRQRVGMARAFCLTPEIFFADEAFGHLDQSTARRLREVFLELVNESKKDLPPHHPQHPRGPGDRLTPGDPGQTRQGPRRHGDAHQRDSRRDGRIRGPGPRHHRE